MIAILNIKNFMMMFILSFQSLEILFTFMYIYIIYFVILTILSVYIQIYIYLKTNLIIYVYYIKVCNNIIPHLRGNVYVDYSTEEEAFTAFCAMNGRWYGGKQLMVEFITITDWKMALCGKYYYYY